MIVSKGLSKHLIYLACMLWFWHSSALSVRDTNVGFMPQWMKSSLLNRKNNCSFLLTTDKKLHNQKKSNTLCKKTDNTWRLVFYRLSTRKSKIYYKTIFDIGMHVRTQKTNCRELMQTHDKIKENRWWTIKETFRLFSNLAWFFVTVGKDVKGEQNMQMSSLCQKILGKMDVRGLNTSLHFDDSLFQHQSFVPQTIR